MSSDGPAVKFPRELQSYVRIVPRSYVCSLCDATGCKLWRRDQPMRIVMLCIDCVLGRKGTFIPAIPMPEDERYYEESFTFPEDRDAWWMGLPNRPEAS